MKYVVSLLRNEFEELFRTSFTLVSGNLKFLNHISVSLFIKYINFFIKRFYNVYHKNYIFKF